MKNNMIRIKRSELPVICPSCGSKLRSYHSSSPMITRRVCAENCSNYHIVAEIIHSDDSCFIDRLENINKEKENETKRFN